jgi:D-serine deaminase-like pyridoxal phosphate-dependent protein
MVNRHALETPRLVLDWGRLRRNSAALHTRMPRLGVNLRPHGKTADRWPSNDLSSIRIYEN